MLAAQALLVLAETLESTARSSSSAGRLHPPRVSEALIAAEGSCPVSIALRGDLDIEVTTAGGRHEFQFPSGGATEK